MQQRGDRPQPHAGAHRGAYHCAHFGPVQYACAHRGSANRNPSRPHAYTGSADRNRAGDGHGPPDFDAHSAHGDLGPSNGNPVARGAGDHGYQSGVGPTPAGKHIDFYGSGFTALSTFTLQQGGVDKATLINPVAFQPGAVEVEVPGTAATGTYAGCVRNVVGIACGPENIHVVNP